MVLYKSIFKSKKKKIAVLIDPGKLSVNSLKKVVKASQSGNVDFFLAGGSIISQNIDFTIDVIRDNSDLPVVLFPGSIYQLSEKADAILLLSLISGRNPDFLIGNHVIAAPFLKKSSLEIISSGYILIDGGNKTSVEYMSNTKPVPSDKSDIVTATAIAGEMLGLSSIYLEAGSGAKFPVKEHIISEVKRNTDIPLIVGGGIRDTETLKRICIAGADITVAGTVFENNVELIRRFSDIVHGF